MLSGSGTLELVRGKPRRRSESWRSEQAKRATEESHRREPPKRESLVHRESSDASEGLSVAVVTTSSSCRQSEDCSASPDASVASIGRFTADRVAGAHCTVLVTGETGTGKGFLAQWLHDHGPRADRPFVAVNCGAIPDSLVDSHLFGHERGAFSDAHASSPGLVRAADGGTLFLDEIGELPPAAQLRLLRLLEEREVQPVGALSPVSVDVRILAATSRDLQAMVDDGTFRLDLYSRLNVVQLELAPLRRRRAEIPALLDALNQELARQIGRDPLVFGADAEALLGQYDWPGNVRELRSVIERLAVLCGDDPVTAHDLQTLGQVRVAPAPTPDAGRRVDHRALAARRLVDDSGGNISEAARRLGVHRSTVHRWLQRVDTPQCA